MVSAHALLLNFYIHVYVHPLLISCFSSNLYKSGYNFDCSIPLCSAVLAVRANQCKQCKQFMGQYYFHFLWYFLRQKTMQCVHPMRNDQSANDLRILGTLVGMVALCTWECIGNVAGLQQCRQEYQFDDFQHVCFCLKGLMNTKNELAKQ